VLFARHIARENVRIMVGVVHLHNDTGERLISDTRVLSPTVTENSSIVIHERLGFSTEFRHPPGRSQILQPNRAAARFSSGERPFRSDRYKTPEEVEWPDAA